MVPLLSQEKAPLLPEESTVKLVNLLISLVLVCAGVFMLNYVKQTKKGKWFNLTVIYSALYVERGSADRKKGKWPEILAIFGHFLMGCVIGAVTWQYSNRFFRLRLRLSRLFVMDGSDVVIWNANALVICLQIIHYSSFIIHYSLLIQAACRALTPSVTRCARATSLKREAILHSWYVCWRRRNKMLKTRFTRKCRCVDLTTRCEENTYLMRQKVNEMRQNRCKDAKIWRTRCEETTHNNIDII